jgi:branched-chain amino acid transport system ATP-binding protein
MTTILETQGLTKRFGGAQVINGIDFRIDAGEVRCVIGPNGAGKSTFFKLLTGEHQPSSGSVMFLGESLNGVLPHQRIRMGMSIKFQIPGVFPELTAREHLKLALHMGRDDHPDAIRKMLADFRLEGEADVQAAHLSHGKKQWLEIAMAVALKPKLLFLDEPVAGMSAEETHATGELVLSLRQRGLTIMVVEHDMTFVRELGVKVTCLHEGTVLAEGTIDQVSTNERVVEVYLGR